ncbi:MAG: cytochrome c oxidase assembly protein [Bdellovibrionales bacterium]
MHKNTKLAIALLLFVAAMVGLAYASVPLYDMFCRVTGFGGTTQVAAQLPDVVSDREIDITFSADVQRDLPWEFRPLTPKITVKLGAPGQGKFYVKNNSDKPITGIATYNVLPEKAGLYFQKVKCFCFEEHTLQPGEAQEIPVLFFIDASIADNPDTRGLKTLTLHYTYFAAKD